MLVEINLLPKKESRNFAFLAIIISSLFITLVVGLVLFWQGSRYDSELKQLNNEILTTQKLIEQEQKVQSGSSKDSDSFAELQSAVQWANNEPLRYAPILKKLTALLPQRGFIQNISYAEAGTVSLTVQFDTSREASYFYKTLLDAEWISAAALSSLSTKDLVEVNSEDQENSTEKKEDENQELVPRYIGQYTITLNRDYINMEEKIKELEEKEQGGEEL